MTDTMQNYLSNQPSYSMREIMEYLQFPQITIQYYLSKNITFSQALQNPDFIAQLSLQGFHVQNNHSIMKYSLVAFEETHIFEYNNRIYINRY